MAPTDRPLCIRCIASPNIGAIDRSVVLVLYFSSDTGTVSVATTSVIWLFAIASAAEPEKIGTEGWLGRVIREIDPKKENVLTAVNFGRGLPRALGLRGVPVASVGDLATYGLFPDIADENLRKYALDAFAKMYGGDVKDPVLESGYNGTYGHFTGDDSIISFGEEVDHSRNCYCLF